MSKYFTLHELCKSETADKKGIKNQPSLVDIENLNRLMEMLDVVRETLGSAIKVTSGYRCPALNKAVGGSKTSQHLKGQAADIKPVYCSVKQLWSVCENLVKTGRIQVGQLIDERNFSWIHISIPDASHHNQILHIK